MSKEKGTRGKELKKGVSVGTPFLYLALCLLLCPSSLWAGETVRYRVYLHDKGGTTYSLDHPEEFLSKEAIDRRIRQGIAIDASDLPISPAYLDSLTDRGATPVVTSKWLATVVVSCTDSVGVDQLLSLSFVDSVKWVWKGDEMEKLPPKESPADTLRYTPTEAKKASPYGYAETQIKMLNGIKLHKKGFQGEGMRVAVVDAGFTNADRISVFDSLRLLGTHNVVNPDHSVFVGDEHGTRVLSCLAADEPGWIRGTAPHASYWLIKSEDNRTEYPVEEDYWVAAMEFADSVGVDVISASLGYFKYDVDYLSYAKDQLDGHTSFITRAASLVAAKGILLFCSAGNEGNGDWKTITVPADAEGILTVGSVTEKGVRSVFSSYGPTADGRIKPDIVAMGSSCCVIDAWGHIRFASGTSFSTPIVAGLGICLWQACPHLTNQEIITLLKQVGSQAKHPDAELGYGIPDLFKAYKLGLKHAND